MTIAYACVLIAVFLPYFAVGLAKAQKGFDNHHPRAWLAKQTGWRARAHAAHLNSFEAFAPFAAGVIMAHLSHASQSHIDALAVTFIVLRIAYIGLYCFNWAKSRTVIWISALACTVALYVIT
jgi:uncharacterized MAPEG superfamily protein